MSSIEPSRSFEQDFYDRYQSIKQRGAALDLTVSDICSRAGVSRATPERWKKRPPLTIRIIDRMEAVVAESERRSAPRQPEIHE